jgi:uncharacterized protein
MHGVLAVVTHALIAIVVAYFLVEIGITIRHRGRLLAPLDARPDGRERFYRRLIGLNVVWVGVVALVTLASADLSAADVGWAWPHGDGLDYAFAALLLVCPIIGGLTIRRAVRRGRTIPGLAALAPLLPRSSRERRLAAGLAFTTGISEELLFRGLLLVAATRLYHLPLWVGVLISLALFVAGHVYRGSRAAVGSAALGISFTGIFLISGSVLLPIVVHVVINLETLLMVPAHPTVSAVPPRPPERQRTGKAPATPATPPPVRSGLPPSVRSAAPPG